MTAHIVFLPLILPRRRKSSGWEKGNVENKVGYLRRNELVPVPRFDTLPAVPFDTSLCTTARTDKYDKFTLDVGKHRYSASPSFCEETVRLRITSAEVVVMDRDLHEVVRHRRLYGDERESMDGIPYLRYIARKPRSLKNSGICNMMPDSMRLYMDSCESGDRGKILKVLAELTDRSGFDNALNTVNTAILHKATDPDSLMNLCRHAYMDVPPLPPLEPDSSVPQMKMIQFPSDLETLDAALKRGGGGSV